MVRSNGPRLVVHERVTLKLKGCAMKTNLFRKCSKANAWYRTDWRRHGLALGILCMVAGPVHGQSSPQNASCQPKFNLNGYDKGVKTAINTHQTNNTSSSCAWADVIMESRNFLACPLVETGPIALCYYSGVPGSPKFTPSWS
jgi:hypothetical protein